MHSVWGGAEGLSDTPTMDPGALFAVLFGSDVFEDYVDQQGCLSGKTAWDAVCFSMF